MVFMLEWVKLYQLQQLEKKDKIEQRAVFKYDDMEIALGESATACISWFKLNQA